MNYDYEQTDLSKSLLAGLFAGIITTCVNLVFNIIYRGVTSFSPSIIINITSIIIGSVLLLTIAGLLFYLFHYYIKRGRIVFRIFFLALTILSVYYSMHVQRSDDVIVSKQFEGLLSGIVVISGAFIVFFIPYLFDHKNIYAD